MSLSRHPNASRRAIWSRPVHVILTNPIYERQTFDEIRRALKARNPRSRPPRVTSGPVLLTGLAHCAGRGSAMTMRTGTSKTGRVYRYNTCSGAARMGKLRARAARFRWTG
jgi:site-specific DNA recombinase